MKNELVEWVMIKYKIEFNTERKIYPLILFWKGFIYKFISKILWYDID